MSPNPGEPQHLFPRERRLLSKARYSHVFADAKRLSGQYFTLLYRPRENGMTLPRLGMAVSKRHARRAVRRNSIKRQIRESFRLCANRLGPLDIVVLTRPSVAEEDPRNLRKEIDQLFLRLP